MTTKCPVSIADVARQAGVARSTVSLALRDHPSIPSTTRQRIRMVAEKLGYRPHPLYASLLAQVRARQPVTQRETLVFITGFPTRDGWRRQSRVFREYFEGARDRAGQLGYQLEEIWAKEPGMTGRRLSGVLIARRIRGLLLGPVPAARGHLSLDWSQFAAAAMGYSVWKPDLNRAVINHYQIATLILRNLQRRGYRRIGLALPAAVDERVNHSYLAAWMVAQRRMPPRDRLPVYLPRVWTDSGFEKWFRKVQPDAVVGISRTVIPDAIRRCGRRIPRQVGFVTLQRDGAADPNAGVEAPARQVGAAAVDLETISKRILKLYLG